MKRIPAIIITLAGLSTAVQAGSILSDDFNYPNGPIVGAAGSPWLFNSGTAGTMLVTNNQLEVTSVPSTRTEDIAAPVAGAPYKTNGAVAAVYSKFTVKFTGLPTAGGAYFAHFNGEAAPPTATLHRARIWSSATNAVTGGLLAAGKLRLSMANSSSGNPASGQWDADLDTNVTYTVVTRYQIATAVSTLWIDPVSEGSPSVTATDVVAAPFINVAYYSFRQASGEGTMRIGSLRVGTAFSDVAGTNTAPTISSIPNQDIPRNSATGPLPFVVGDKETPPGSLTVTGASTNLTLVPLSGIVINNGDGTNRTATVTPTAGQQGTTLVTLTVSDGVNTAQSSFRLAVGAPVISVIPNQIAYVNTAVPPIHFTVVDPEADPLTPSATSSYQGLLTNEKIAFSSSGTNYTLTLTPEVGMTGVTTVTVSFTDGSMTTSRSFVLSVSPQVELLLADAFTYTAFNVSPNSLYDAVGSPWQTVSGTPYQIQVTNGWAYLGTTNTEDVAAPLAGGPYASTNGLVVYSSFTLRQMTLPVGPGSYFAHTRDTSTGTTFRDKLFSSTNGAGANSFRIGIANAANVGAYFPLDCTLGADYLVVTRYNSGTGESVLWINPLTEASPSQPATDAPTTAPVGFYGLREDTATQSQGDLQISNLVISTSFPVIPVPASIAITGISVAGSTVTVSFDAGASDTAANFELLGTAVVTGSYSATGAVITSPSAGKFQAAVATAGAAQFYRVHRK